MPTQKDLKRIVRNRMRKTGESYTSARSKVLGKDGPSPFRFAEIAGMSDAAVAAKTGMNWRQWVQSLDAADADKLTHREIARYVGARYDLGSTQGQQSSIPHGPDPPPGEGYWYLVRPRTTAGVGTYDPPVPGWTAGRDAEIGASGRDCR